MQQQPTVAVLGLGAMGHAFAANLLKNAFTVYGWNRTRARGEDLIAGGLILCDTPQQAVQAADVVLVMLSDAATTADVLGAAQSSMAPNAVLCQMGTIGVAATEQLIGDFAGARPDVVFLDAPVSGTKAPAENAQILILASGDRERAGAVLPVFAAISKGAKWLGAAGAGSRMKLVVNAWLIALMQGLAESAQLAQELGFSIDDFWDALEGGPLAAPYAKGKLEMIKRGDFTAQMKLDWALKDADLALAAAKTSVLPGLTVISQLWRQAVDAGLGEEDLSVIYRYLHDRQPASE